jgi:HK97 family phage major capsid protein
LTAWAEKPKAVFNARTLMKKKLLELQGKYKALLDEIKRLGNLPDPSEEDEKAFNAAVIEKDAVKVELDKAVAAVKALDDAEVATKEWHTPAIHIKMPGSNGDAEEKEVEAGAGSKARIVGYNPAGKTTFFADQKDLEILQEGEGIIPDKKMAHLVSREYKRGFAAYVKAMGIERNISNEHYKALQEGIDDSGGYWVPPDWTNRLVDRTPTPTSVNPLVTTWTTTSNRKVFPKNNYTGASADDANANLYTTGVRLTYPGEIPASSTTVDATDPTPGQLEINVNTAMMSLSATLDQFEDDVVNTMDFILSKFAETESLEHDKQILTGSGVGKAAGIINNPSSSATGNQPQYIASGAAAALTADGLKDLMHGLPPQYLMNSRFVMNWMNTAAAIDKLKDGEGRYLWSTGLQDNGLSDNVLTRRLLGFPPIYSEFMPNVAANAYPIIFGNLASYWLVRRVGMSIKILDQTKAKTNQVEILGRLRFGGEVAEPWGLKVQKVST